MDMNLFLAVALVGALTGALGFLAALALRRFWHVPTRPQWVALAAAVAGGLIGAAVVGGWPAQLFGAGERIAVDDVLPYTQLIKTHEPLLYERIETSVIRDQEEGMSAAEVRANARSLVMSYVADKTAFLPDDLTYELFAATRDQLAYFGQQEDYAACAELALGRAKGDLHLKLTEELAERSDNNAMRVISTKKDEAAIRMPAEEFAQLANRAFAEASQATGIPPDELDNLLAGTGDQAKTCKLMKGFFDAILAQPVATAAAALRKLASGERAGSP